MLPLLSAKTICDERFDSLVIVGDDPLQVGHQLQPLAETLHNYCLLNQSLLRPDSVNFVVADASLVPSGRVVFANCGRLNGDTADSRVLYEAAGRGVSTAAAAGSRRPLLCRAGLSTLPDATVEWTTAEHLDRAILMGALQSLYLPLEAREAGRPTIVDALGFFDVSDKANESLKVAEALEEGRRLARDIGGSDPERMTPARIAETIANRLEGTCVSVSVEERIDKDKYPLLAAVNRASPPRHAGRIVRLRYPGDAELNDTNLLLVGKGVTFDTGGLNLKPGIGMAGMHRDKCGAAALAGLSLTIGRLRPRAIGVECSLALVRNTLGSDSYSPDELLLSRAGVRVRVGNTDAEGRMAMADLLSVARERALQLPESAPAHIFTVATLTGHAVLAYGSGYSIAMGNGPATLAGVPQLLQRAGEAACDPFEISTVRREDFDFVRSSSLYEDVLQSNPQPSAVTPRGHQFPAAFLAIASGLDKHGRDSSRPLSYTHVDIAGSAGRFKTTPPTASPLLAFAVRYILPRIKR